MSIPYFDMGERIRKNSVRLNIDGPGDINYTATDDGYGNLRDHQIDSASFASSSKSVLHLSFNNEYRQFRFQQGGLGTPTHPFPYFLKTAPTNLNHYQKQTANTYEYKDIDIVQMYYIGQLTLGDALHRMLQTRLNPSSGWGKKDIDDLANTLGVSRGLIDEELHLLENRLVIHWCENVSEYIVDSRSKCDYCKNRQTSHSFIFGVKEEIKPSDWPF